jgi:hypothetical protein
MRSRRPPCKKDVEPVVPDAMPGATLGHSVVALTSWFHYGLGITIAPVIDIRRIRDGIRLRKRPDFTPQRYRSRIHLLDRRLTELAQWPGEDDTPIYRDADTLRIAQRLHKHWDFLFTFLDKPEVPFDNNLAEGAIRPAVILRKNSQSNRSEQGAATQGILMSVFRTLKLRGIDPTKTITAALRSYLQTGTLPPPDPIAAVG